MIAKRLIYVTLICKKRFYYFSKVLITYNTFFGYISKTFNTFSSQGDTPAFSFFVKVLTFFCRVFKEIVFQSRPSVDSFVQFFIHKRSMVSSRRGMSFNNFRRS